MSTAPIMLISSGDISRLYASNSSDNSRLRASLGSRWMASYCREVARHMADIHTPHRFFSAGASNRLC